MLHERSQIVKNIVNSLINNPEEWKLKKYTIEHINGVAIVTINGMLGLRISAPHYISFSIVEKYDLWQAIKEMKSYKVNESIGRKE